MPEGAPRGGVARTPAGPGQLQQQRHRGRVLGDGHGGGVVPARGSVGVVVDEAVGARCVPALPVGCPRGMGAARAVREGRAREVRGSPVHEGVVEALEEVGAVAVALTAHPQQRRAEAQRVGLGSLLRGRRLVHLDVLVHAQQHLERAPLQFRHVRGVHVAALSARARRRRGRPRRRSGATHGLRCERAKLPLECARPVRDVPPGPRRGLHRLCHVGGPRDTPLAPPRGVACPLTRPLC